MARRRPRSGWAGGIVALAAGLSAGCAEELGPESFRTTTLTGKLTVSGQPLGPGWLEILPTDGTTGLLRSARVERDGTFRAERVPVGEVAMRLVGFPPIRTGVPTTDRFLQEVRQVYGIRRRIRPEGGPVSWELAEDARRRAAEGS